MSLKQEIQHEFKDMVLKKNNKITIQEICQRVNISRKTFYKYYADEYHLVRAMIHEDLFEPLSYMSQMQELCVDDSVLILSSLYNKIYEDRHYYQALNQHHHLFLDIFFKETYALNEVLFKSRDIEEDFEREYQIYLAAMAGTALMKKWMEDGFVLSPRQVAQLFFKYVTRAWVEDLERYQSKGNI